MNTKAQISELAGVGAALAQKFERLGVKTIQDLVEFFPRRYEDFSRVTPAARLRPGPVTIDAKITEATGRYARRGMHITEAVARDDTASVRLVWFNQPYRAAGLKAGESYFISGNYELRRQHFAIMNPSVELRSDFPLNAARILPVYRETKGLNSKRIRQVIKQVLPAIRASQETLPGWILEDFDLLSRAQALEAVHFPKSSDELAKARWRLGFEEVFELMLSSLMVKREILSQPALPIPFEEKIAKQFVAHLPFKMTDAQRRVVWQIYLDLQKKQPMNRLVEGDVGSGKTVVAAMAAAMAMKAGAQAALMAPTELLARQHAETLAKLLEPLGFDKKLVLLVGNMKPAQKAAARQAIANGQAQFIVGTHALISDSVDFGKLALVIVDEQHRFGVDQRNALQAKAGHAPHVLSLTATPIPRSLALTLYGELDVSVLGEKPPSRTPIITKIVSPNSKAQLYEAVKKELGAGRQMFVVCPLISESEMLAANSAEKVYEQFSTKDFKEFQVGLLHGRQKAADKQKTMRDFVQGKLDILVSTTVIEVGVDVPNASVMLIEAPERFGLAQIHQLRGRVGRGKHQGYCYLMMSDSRAPGRRLKALEHSQDGFELAELDLEMRGPGAIYGHLQHGHGVALLVARLTDQHLIAQAKQAAERFLGSGEDLLKYKELATRVMALRAVTNLD